MKKAKIREGEIVKVPTTQFAPYRSGWAGWLFEVGRILRVYTGQTGKTCVEVEVCNPQGAHKFGTYVKRYVATSVFDGRDDVAYAQSRYDEIKAEGKWENAVGAAWIEYLISIGAVKA